MIAKFPRTILNFAEGAASRCRDLFSYLEDACRFLKFKKDFIPRDDDVYVASFPRSGTTWTMSILYHLAHGHRESFNNFEHIYQVIPWWELHGTRGFAKTLNELPSPRVFKTHMPKHHPRRGKFVCVYRDPRDAIISLYHHAGMIGNSIHMESRTVPAKFALGEVTLDQWLHRTDWIIGQWAIFMRQWVDRHQQDNVLLVSYESMKLKPEEMIEKIGTFVGFNVNKNIIEQVAENTSFNRMQRDQDRYSDYGTVRLVKRPSAHFIRSGNTGGWKQLMNSAQKQQAIESMQKHFKRHGLERIDGIAKYLTDGDL